MTLNLSTTISLANLGNADVAAALADMQGNVLRGHGRDATANVFVRFDGPEAGRALLNQLLGQLTSARTQLDQAAARRATGADGGLFTVFLLTAAGYRQLGIPNGQIPADGQFRAGMEASGARLSDPARSSWDATFIAQIHGLILLAHSEPGALAIAVNDLVTNLPSGITVTGIERGIGRKNQAGNHIEHFGYVDGRSQPLVVTEDIAAEPSTVFKPEILLRQVFERCPGGATDNSLGSYLVFRKLDQNVAGFKTMEETLAAQLGVTEDLAGAMAVGRFEDGTPLAVSATPTGSVSNDFDYAADTRTPTQAHIRKTNPRSDLGASSMRPQMVRRGITYGDRADDPNDRAVASAQRPAGGVGLLFMAYQSNIADQFEFMQAMWANNGGFIAPTTGLDPVIGQGGAGGQTWTRVDGTNTRADFAGFVTLKGGEYFFQPSLSMLRSLVDDDQDLELSAALALPSAELGVDDSGRDVATIQTFLAGYRAAHVRLGSAGAIPSDPGAIDGDFGPRTAASVRSLQGRFGLVDDGIWGPRTAQRARQEARLVSVLPAVVVRVGATGPTVASIQRFLAARSAVADRLAPGSDAARADPGSIDGAYGPVTEAAVRAWQRFLGVDADGVWGPQTAASSQIFTALVSP